MHRMREIPAGPGGRAGPAQGDASRGPDSHNQHAQESLLG